jgi:hypothetical protein
MTAGSVPFFGTGGLLSQDNSKLFWDNTAKQFYVGARTGYSTLLQGYTNSVGFVGSLNSGAAANVALTAQNEDNTTNAQWGLYGVVESDHTSGNRPESSALEADAYHTGAGTVTDLDGVVSYVERGSGGGAATNASLFRGGGMVKAGAAAITNAYGLLLPDISVATNNWAIKTGAGKVQFGDTVQAAKNLAAAQNAMSFSATPTFDGNSYNSFKMTLTGNVTSSTLSGGLTGQQITLLLCQDATGNRTMTWPANLKLSGGAFTLTTTASKCDSLTALYDGTSWYETARAANL